MVTNSFSTSGRIVSEDTSREDILKKVQLKTATDGFSSLGRSAVAVVEDFAVVMGTKSIPTEAVRQAQFNALYNALFTNINRNNEDFHKVFTRILKIFEEGRESAFHERRLWGFMPIMPISVEKRNSFGNLLFLMKTAAPVKGRQDVFKQVNVEKSLGVGITEEGRQRVINFFS